MKNSMHSNTVGTAISFGIANSSILEPATIRSFLVIAIDSTASFIDGTNGLAIVAKCFKLPYRCILFLDQS